MSINQHSASLNHNGAEKLLNEQDLGKISGGTKSDRSQLPQPEDLQKSAGVSSNVSQPNPTFPVPLHPEDSL